MDYKKLKIGHIDIIKNKVYIGANFLEDEARFAARNKGYDYFMELYRNKKLLITGQNYVLETNFIDIKLTSSIADFKNIHFLTDLDEIGEIKINDLIKVMD